MWWHIACEALEKRRCLVIDYDGHQRVVDEVQPHRRMAHADLAGSRRWQVDLDPLHGVRASEGGDLDAVFHATGLAVARRGNNGRSC